MNPKHKNQYGFGLIEALLLIIAVALVVFVGYYVWHSQKTSDSALNQSNATSQKTAALRPTVKYLTITEWGVKVPELPAGNILSYKISSDGTAAAVVSSEQKALGGYCGQFDDSRYSLLREPQDFQPTDDYLKNQLQASKDSGQAITIDQMVYYIIPDFTAGDCTGKMQPGQTMSQQEKTANQDLLNSLKGLVKA